MSILQKKDKPITFRIDDETYEKIEELVKQNKTSVSLEIRKMIDFYLESKDMSLPSLKFRGFSRLKFVVPPSGFFFSIAHIPRHGNLFRRF